MLSNVLTSNLRRAALIELARAEGLDILVLQEVNQAWLNNLNALRDVMPYVLAEPRNDNFGIAVYSRIPFVEAKVVALLDETLPSILAKVSLNGQIVSILTTHPLPPLGGDESFFLRNAQLRVAAVTIRQQPDPKILIGDLNLTAWSPYYVLLVKESGLVDARKGFGVIPTWPANYRLPIFMIPIDQCLISPVIKVRSIRAGPHIGSDHLPLIVELDIPV